MRYCRELHNLELHKWHSVPSTIRGSKRVWVRHGACVSDTGEKYKYTWNFD